MSWIIGLIAALFRAFVGEKQASQADRDAGKNEAHAENSTQAAKTQAAIAQAATEAPKNKADVVDKLRRGEF